MDEQPSGPSTVGIGMKGNWLLGGAIGGVVGSLLFGIVLWSIDPALVREAIPAIYGFDPGPVGWAFHIAHGMVLGIVFGFLVSRQLVLGTIAADVETGFIAAMGLSARLALAGIVYGLALFAFLPFIVLPIWIGLTGVTDPEFTANAGELLMGHVLYGFLLGVLFSALTETAPKAADAEAPFEEAGEERR